jgi:putative membrane protein
MLLWTALFAFLHHLAAFTVVATLVFEHAAFAPVLSVEAARKLRRIDVYYGFAAAVLVVVGFLRVFYFEKGASYYFHDAWFIVKISLFALVGILSIYPTRVFLSWRAPLAQDRAPEIPATVARGVRVCLMLELAGIVGILLAAPLMARGFGYFGG